uniref:VCBS domain-containing protein n=1 Tax=uncultured Psychromonas sp. TaxID=173974 RepID=UPI002629E2E0
ADGTVKYTPNADFNGSDSFTYTNEEGEVGTVNVTITPQDDPTIIQIAGSNSAQGRVLEDGGNLQSVQGTFIFSDADYTESDTYEPTSTFISSTGGSEAIGNFTLTPTPTASNPGQFQWEYVLNNEAAQYLDAGESIIEIYTVTINGATTDVPITIFGAEDPTEITVDVSVGDTALGEVTEDKDINDDKLTVSGKLTFSDVDTTDSENFNPTVTFTNTTGTAQLGLLTINPDGTWNYEVDNTNNEIQGLDSNETITETHTVNLNGTVQDIVITINGVDYAPEAVDDTEMTYDTTIRLDELPQYGTLQVSVDGVWVDMVAGEEYDSDSEVQFVPDEEEIKLNSVDIGIGSFDDDGSSDYVASVNDWGTVNSDGTAVTAISGNATIKTSLKTTDENDSTILTAWNGKTHIGNGIGNGDDNGLSQGETLVIDIEGENINEVTFTLDGLGGYFDESSKYATKVSITAYFEDGTSEIQSHYRQSGSFVDTYTFTFDKESPVDRFELTTSGSNGTYVVQNMTLSRTVTDEITFTRTQADGSETTESVVLDLNYNDASEAVDLTNDLPAVDTAITEGVIFTDENSSIAIDLLSNDFDDDNEEIIITEIAGQSVIDGGDAVDITVDGLIVGTGKLVDGKLVFTPSEELGVTLNDGDSKEIDIEYTISDGSKTGTAKATVRVDGVDEANNLIMTSSLIVNEESVSDASVVTSQPVAFDDASPKTGLSGKYWGYDEALEEQNTSSLDVVKQYIIDNPTADISFISTKLDYKSTGDVDQSSGVAVGADDSGIPANLVAFLNSDADSIVTIDGGSSETATDGIIAVSGNLNVEEAGIYLFTVNHDDGFQLIIDGEDVFTYSLITAPVDSIAEIALSAGLHSVEIIYWDQGGDYVLDLNMSLNGIGDNVWIESNLSNTEDSPNTLIDTPITLDLLANDVGQGISINTLSDPEYGSLEIVNGDVVYTPNDGYTGTDSFTYTIKDENGSISNAAVAYVTVLHSAETGVLEEVTDISDATVTNTDVMEPVESLTADADSTIQGDWQDNTLTGGSGNDEIFGVSGNDILNGGAGNDMLDGASGEDILNGDDGEDTLYGKSQNDTLNGGAGNDTLYGDSGDDTLNGDDGDDQLFGGSNEDTLNGGAGNDTLYGDTDNDTLNGDDGDDLLFGGSNTDALTGGAGDDQLSGDGGEDQLDGGLGDDILIGGVGNDLLTGGAGIDTFVWTASDTYGSDTITDFNVNEDKLDLSDLLQGESENTLGDYLDFSFDGKDTTITTYKDGGDSPTQTIVLEDTQLEGIETEGQVSGGDKEIVINNLLNDGALIIGDTIIENTSTPIDDEIV